MTIWDKRIQKAEKFLEAAWQHGQRVYERYADKRDGGLGGDSNIKRANIFYSNVNTLKESLFNSLPRADVSRLHKGDVDNDVARVGSIIMQRGLDYEIQCADDFKSAVRGAILDRLVPGIGQVWVRFDIETTEQGEPLAGTEQIFIERVYWEDFIYGPARDWRSVPWVGRKLNLTKQEIVARWGEAALTQMQATRNSQSNLTPKQITDDTYLVYEIWDKKSRKVFWVSKGAQEPLEVKDDPYKLKDFFPCPEPLIANANTTAFLPVTDYHISQDQYNQLDVLYARIAMIITAIKVSGLYDASSPEIGRMLEGQENKLIPVENWAMFMEKGGATGAIQWYPIEQVATVLQQLQAQYEAVKSILFEVSGMADIIRGGSNQYETAAAQQIKAQFASVRMGGYQRDVAEFVTGILNIMGEMVVQLYSTKKLQAIVGNLDPHDVEYAPAAVEMLRNDLLAQYNVTIQADSLTQSDWALEKGQRMELIGYISQYMQSMLPTVQTNPDIAPLLLTMLKFTIAGYRGAAEIEGAIDKELDSMLRKQAEAKANPQPPPPPPEVIKAQADMQMQEREFAMQAQAAQEESQREYEKMQLEAELQREESAQRMLLEKQQADLDAEVQRRKIEGEALLQAQKARAEQEMQELERTHKEALLQMQLRFAEEKLQIALAGKVAETEIAVDAKEDAAEEE